MSSLLSKIIVTVVLILSAISGWYVGKPYTYYLPMVTVNGNFNATKKPPTKTPRPTPTLKVTPTPTITPTKTVTLTTTPTMEITIVPALGYYVDSVNGSDSNSGLSVFYPLKSIEALNSKVLKPKDIIYLKSNSVWDTKLDIQESGLEGEEITFTSYGEGNLPIIAGVNLESDYNIIENIEITNAGVGIWIKGNHNIIYTNYIHDLHMERNTVGGNDDFGAVAFILSGSNNEIAYNTIINCKAESYDYGLDGGVVDFWGIANNNLIHSNYTENNKGFLEVGGSEAKDNFLYNNKSVNNGSFAVFHLSGTFTSVVENFVIQDNTITQDYWINLFYFNGIPTESMVIFKHNDVGYNSGMNRESFLHIYNSYKGYPSLYDGTRITLGEGEYVY